MPKPPPMAATVMTYCDRDTAGQCGTWFNATAPMAPVTEALRDGVATSEDNTRHERWSVVLRGRGACATLDAATNVAVMRVVVREGFSYDLADDLIDALNAATEYLSQNPPRQAAKPGFSHT